MKSNLKRILAETAVTLAFLILPLALYASVTIGPDTMIPADNLYQWQPWRTYAAEFDATVPDNSLLSDMVLQNYVWKQYIRDTVSQGDIPLWNPHLFAGAPFLATGQNAAYYPFSLLFLIMPLTKAYGWYAVSQLWLAGALMYVFGRVLRLGRAASLVGGLVYQGCGFMIVSAAVFPMIIGAAAWLPLLLACLEMIVSNTTNVRGDGRTLPWVAGGALGLGMQILAGHIEITYYTLLVMAFYAAWRLGGRYLAGQWQFSESGAWNGRQSWLRLIRPPAWLLTTVVVGLMLGGIQFIPFYEVGVTNFREGSSTLAEVRGWAFPERRALAFAVPDFFGNPADHAYTDAFTGERVPLTTNVYGEPNPHGAYTTNWGIKNYVEGGAYLGILPLLLAGLGVVYGFRRGPRDAGRGIGRRRATVGFFVVLAVLSLAFIFGTPLYAILYYGFPGINQLHSPFRWVFPLSLCVAGLAAYGLEYLFLARNENRDENTAARRWATWGGNAMIAAGALVLVGLYASRAFYPAVESLIEQIFLGLAQAPDAFPSTRAFYSYQFTNTRHFGLILLAAGIVIRLARCGLHLPLPARAGGRIPIFAPAAAVVIVLDLLIIGYGFNASVDPALLHFKPQMVQWLQEQTDPHLWRITSLDNKGQKPFNANAGWLTGLQDVRGYDSIIAKQYTEYMAAIEPQNELQFNRIQPLGSWEAINSPLVDLLNIKYIITAETLDLPKLELAWQGEGLRVYQNLAVMPRAFTLSTAATVPVDGDDQLTAVQTYDPRQHVIVGRDDWAALTDPLRLRVAPAADRARPAQVAAYSNREVTVEAAVTQESWLVLTDSYFPGWRAFIRPLGGDDESETELNLVRVNGNFRGVVLPPGEWSVRFRYSPQTFLIGGLTSVMGLILIVFAFAVWLWRTFYRPQGELTNTRSIAKNSMAPMALNLFNRAIDFLFAAFYLRLLGPADSGAFTTAVVIAGIYEILANFGLNAYLIREVSQDKQKTSSYLLNTTVLRLFTGLLAAVPILLFVWASGYRADTATAVIFLIVGMVLSGMASGLAGLSYAYEEAEIPASITTVTTILKVGFGVIVLLLGFGFVGLAANSILVNFLTLFILGLIAYRRYPLRGPWRVDFGLQKAMIRHSYPLMINHFLATIYWQIDVVILSQFNGEEVVAWYNSAYKYVNAFNVIPSFFTFALFPVIARQVNSNLDDARRTFRMSIKLLTLVSLPLAAVVTLLAPIMIQLLGGAAFLPFGYIALQTVIWSIPFGWLNSVTNYVLISLGQERVQTWAFVFGAGFNMVGNLILLPLFGNDGRAVIAAGVTTILSEILLLALFNYYLVQKMPSIHWLKLLWRPTAVAGVMLAVMLGMAAVSNVWLGLLVGAGVYPLGLWALNVFGAEEQRILAAVLPAPVVDLLRLET